MGRVLVVDDEPGLREVLEVLIRSKGHAVFTAATVPAAIVILQREKLDLVVTDLRIEPGGSGLDVIRAARATEDAPEVIVMTAFGTRDTARAAIDLGASFYLEKGPNLAPDLEVLVTQAVNKRRLASENEALRRALVDRHSVAGIIGKSEAMQEVFERIERIAQTSATVLIFGESGTGKERVAKAIHFESARRNAPFVPLNCGAIPENLIESELFGHTKGAFTGADHARDGLFVAARGGTLFLDEIGELPLALQPKLLRVLQERKIKPVGASIEVDVDARVIAASNRDLEAEVRAGRFREDLFFRLNVLEIELPPLRLRREDIPLLATTFLAKYSKEYGRAVASIAPDAMERLLSFRYPGNVRQLENAIERGVALATGTTLGASDLPKDFREAEPPLPAVQSGVAESFPERGVDLERLVEHFEHELIVKALEKAGGVKTRAAELLSLSFRQFRYKLEKYDKRKVIAGTARETSDDVPGNEHP